MSKIEDLVINIKLEDATKEIFLTLTLEYVFHTEEKANEMIKLINEFAKEHDEGCQKRTYLQETLPLYKRSRD